MRARALAASSVAAIPERPSVAPSVHEWTPARSTQRERGTATGSSHVARREIPVSTELDVRLPTTLNSGTAQVEDRFEATTLADLVDRRAARSCRPARSMRGVGQFGRRRRAV